MNITSTAPRGSCLRIFSVESDYLYNFIAVEGWRRISAICGHVAPAGMKRSMPGLKGAMNDVALNMF